MLLAMPLAGLAYQSGVSVVPIGPGRDAEAALIRDEHQREMQLRNLETRAKRSDEKAVKSAVGQLNQDFKRIQVLRNDIAHALKTRDTLDYKSISDQTAEVKKRALRMQNYLALRDPGTQPRNRAEQVEYDDKQIKEALVRLCKRIDSFVANPKFTTLLVTDIRETASVSRDLQEIIALSVSIKGSAENLNQKHR